MERNTKDRGYGYKKAYEYEEEIEKMNLTKEEKQEKETLKKQLFDDPTWSVLTDNQYPLKVSRYNYLVMKEINSILTSDES
mgnify:FL=1